MHHGKGTFIIVHMPNISQHATGYNSIRPHDQIGDTAIENGHAQPRFGRQLQAPTEKVANEIAVTDNDFKLVHIFLARFAAVNVIVKGTFDTALVLINFGNCRFVNVFWRWNDGCWSVLYQNLLCRVERAE